MAAIDFEKAFYSIKRGETGKTLKAREINKTLIEIRDQKHVWKYKKCSTGRRKNNQVFKQPKELVSPVLFIIVMDEISKKRKEPI